MAPTKDEENGATHDYLREPQAEEENLGEYSSLVRYISTYRDTKKTEEADEDAAPSKKPWYNFWSKKSGGSQGAFEAPDDWVETDMATGLSTTEVENRRRKTGWNELTTEKENLFIKFLMFFTGPILYGECSGTAYYCLRH